MDENNRQKNRQKKMGDALMKVALGCRIEEVTEEFAEVDGELRLTRRRETRKDIPPDLKAVQMLLTGDAEDSEDCSRMTDEELEAEKERLMGLLQKKSGRTETEIKADEVGNLEEIGTPGTGEKVERAGSRKTERERTATGKARGSPAKRRAARRKPTKSLTATKGRTATEGRAETEGRKQ